MTSFAELYACNFKQDNPRELEAAFRDAVNNIRARDEHVCTIVQYKDLTPEGKNAVEGGTDQVCLHHVARTPMFAQLSDQVVFWYRGATKVLKDRYAVDTSPPRNLEVGGVYRRHDGSLVKLDRHVPGDGTAWYAATWSEQMGAWTNDDALIEPSDLAVETEDPKVRRGQQDLLQPPASS